MNNKHWIIVTLLDLIHLFHDKSCVETYYIILTNLAFLFPYLLNPSLAIWFHSFQILNDVNGNLDAKKACIGALKLHKKYLKKVLQYYYFLYFSLPLLKCFHMMGGKSNCIRGSN